MSIKRKEYKDFILLSRRNLNPLLVVQYLYIAQLNEIRINNIVSSAGADRPKKGYAENRLTASSFHSTPVPKASSMIAMPFSIRSGSARMGFHQSAYSSQCAVGVQHRRRALISGQRWLDTRIPFACASVAALRPK